MKKIAILGSTGSIGTQTLEVINNSKDKFKLILLSAYSNYELLIDQAIKFKPKIIIFADKSKRKQIENKLSNFDTKIFYGEKSLNNFFSFTKIDIVVTALVGKSGLIPTVNAINNNIDIALANKETMVIA